ncbi:DNA mismatch repair protein, putative [Theileria equi strain WA]|uniref:DNA mismatch repair protein, putative n=1 Tax=Theileria equi strain WA TaxID=1537102 RepID=L1LBG1_THEEQ|nr:DNA mismatch repair protein, putative [Theileria equi strain WA]EKX72671.1 DNA mismatch repair protein, putative [Theileria equi strain WA]|eukprot:XP_004832123.1 DNA mismatch repair protein, putative [Theileria equi strain WA]
MPLLSLPSERTTVSRSLQVINNVNCVIRELVENSIDAKATSIEIRLTNSGHDLIQVSDNGTGISESNFEILARKNTTSKIRRFEDLYSSLNTFGFRGEALYSLCNVCDVEVETRRADINYGWHLKYDADANLVEKTRIAANVGTTVSCRELFKPFPVRRKLLLKSGKSQLPNGIFLLQQYALVNPHIRFYLSNKTTSNQNISNLFSTSGKAENMKQVAEEIFGKTFVANLIEVDISTRDWNLRGMISSPHNGKQYKDVEFFFINNRPVDNSRKLRSCIVGVYKQFSSRLYPSFILNLSTDSVNVDINLAPDKRSVFIYSEDIIINKLKAMLFELFMPTRSQTIPQFNVDILDQFLHKDGVEEDKTIKVKISDEDALRLKKAPKLEEEPVSTKNDQECDNKEPRISVESKLSRPAPESDAKRDLSILNLSEYRLEKSQPTEPIKLPTVTVPQIEVVKKPKISAPIKSKEPLSLFDYLTTRPVRKHCSKKRNVVHIDKSRLYMKKVFKSLLGDNDESTASDAQTDSIDDHDLMDPSVFKEMKLCGQFNNGFIITILKDSKIRQGFDYSIYIIDQHAADEKARFEDYNQRVKIKKQKLISPRFIELSPYLSQVAQSHCDTLNYNGFETVTKSAPNRSSHGIYVNSFPQLFGRILSEDDLISFLNDLSNSVATIQDEKQISKQLIWGNSIILPRPIKIWSILATRACKDAIKLGDALSTDKMRSIIKKLSTLVHPWNCPHGRPTMKCLISSSQLNSIFSKK